MAKIRLTKNELKKQKESLARFTRYLPTLELKKAQLITEIRRIRREIDDIRREIEEAEKAIREWVDVFAEDVNLDAMFSVDEIVTDIGNIAGIDIELFKEVKFIDNEYDLFTTPHWVDKGLEAVKEQIERRAIITILERQIRALEDELKITIQRINLFEKVKIPECKESIRMIRIYLGDLQTAEVVRGKISKQKIEKKKELAAA